MGKITDLMADKVGRFTDLGAVLLEYYRAKSSNGLNTRPWEIEIVNAAFKLGGFTNLVVVFENHCSLCTCWELSEN